MDDEEGPRSVELEEMTRGFLTRVTWKDHVPSEVRGTAHSDTGPVGGCRGVLAGRRLMNISFEEGEPVGVRRCKPAQW